ncbi:MAG: carbon-nitrogen hydrolase family protein [Maricaulaceae bacterium]
MIPLTAAAVQTGSVLFDTPRTLEKLEALTADAARQGASLIVFPEAFVGGYPKGVDFGARVGSRSPEGRDWFRRYFEAAIDVPGPETNRIAKAAKAAKATLAVGVMEREGGTLYCSTLTVTPDGAIAGRHRKLMPTAMERLIWGSGDGSTLDVCDTPAGRVGGLICWERFMPLARAAIYAQGVEIWTAPTVDDRDTWAAAMQMTAMEGRCFVVSACQHLRRKDAPADYAPIQGEDAETVLIRGGSLIVDPLGEVLAGPVFGEDAIVTAELDPRQIARGKFDFDVTGHYARPDVFELRVDTTARRPVRFSPANAATTAANE